MYARLKEDAEWIVIHDQKATEQDFEYKGFSADNSVLYYTLSQNTGPNALYTYNFANGEKKQVSRDDNVDPGALMSSPIDDTVYAVRYEDGFPRYEYLDKSNAFAKNLIKLHASFPDIDVYPVSATMDGRNALKYRDGIIFRNAQQRPSTPAPA